MRDNFQKHEGILSWFSSVIPCTNSFVVDERVVWIDVEGVPSIAWTPNNFSKIALRWGELFYLEDPNDNNL